MGAVVGIHQGSKQALTKQQEIFVKAYVANGGDKKAAGEAAGYVDPGSQAWHQLQTPKILQAIHDETLRAFATDAPVARKVLVELMTMSLKDTIRLEAAKALLGYAGMNPAQRHEIAVSDTRTDEQIRERITALMEDLGMRAPLTLEHDNGPETD
jgi:phage terminase small subunit